MTIHKEPNFKQIIHMLSKTKGSPCIKCLVNVSCTKSFLDRNACENFAKFIRNILIRRGVLNEIERK